MSSSTIILVRVLTVWSYAAALATIFEYGLGHNERKACIAGMIWVSRDLICQMLPTSGPGVTIQSTCEFINGLLDQ
jgi:hypothetical protein